MNEDIKKQIQRELGKLSSSFTEHDMKRRETAAKDMQDLINRTNILNGGIFTPKDLCDSIKIQKRVQGINPVVLPLFVGNYNYNVHFKGYKRSEEEFVKENPKKYEGTSGHRGTDLKEFSKNLANLLKAKGNDFAECYIKMIETMGVGKAILSGYLHLYNPEKYPLVNEASIGGIEYFIGKQNAASLKNYANKERERVGINLHIKSAKLRNYLAWSFIFRELLEFEELKNFHYVDHFAWWINKNKKKDHYFAIAIHKKNVERWDQYLSKGYHAIGWGEVKRDLSGISEGELDEIIKESYPDESAHTRAAYKYCLLRFINLEPGDKVIANNGKQEIMGVGEVVSGYYYDKEAPDFKHRVKVNWYDKNRRETPLQSGWMSTLKVLSEGEFNDIINYKPQEVSKRKDGYFTKEMFEWFEGLSKNPTKTYYSETRFKFNQHVKKPIKNLIQSIESQLDPLMLLKLETEKRILASILKNDYGVGGAYDYLWFAFYPRGSSRIRDAQLYCSVNKDIVSYGFSVGAYAEEARANIRKNVLRNKEDSLRKINSLQNLENVKLYYRKEAHKPSENNEIKCNLPIEQKQLGEWLESDHFGIAVEIDKDMVMSREDISKDIVHTFKRLFPIWMYAISDEINEEEQVDEIEEISEDEDEQKYTKEQLLNDIYFDEKDMDHILHTIERKKNVVFYGPPGTGKTYVAMKIAKYLADGKEGNLKSIQFHQSYSYEDFIEGIRPMPRKNPGDAIVIDYPIKPGIFKSLCQKASVKPDQKFIILIDEFNRGNISKIFGELLFLLEYRKRDNSIVLPYSKEEFFIPDNVIILATMNTADRSLTHIDFAMKRRFSFIKFTVDTGILTKWGNENGLVLESLISVLDEVNEEIGDERFSLGTSYFMNEQLQKNIESIWRCEIFPYIEDCFMDSRDKKAEEFSWEKVKPRLTDLLSNE